MTILTIIAVVMLIGVLTQMDNESKNVEINCGK